MLFQRIYTDANIMDQDTHILIEEFATKLLAAAEESGHTIPEGSDLVLELESDHEGGCHWTYYFACHTARTLFWVHEYDIAEVLVDVLGEVSLCHLGTPQLVVQAVSFDGLMLELEHLLQRYYWSG